jgi:hypothetical protein
VIAPVPELQPPKRLAAEQLEAACDELLGAVLAEIPITPGRG